MATIPYGTPPTAIWAWNSSNSSYSNLTLPSRRLGGTIPTVLENDSDYLYIGFSRRFDSVIAWLIQGGSFESLKWEFNTDDVSESGWEEFIPFQLHDEFLRLNGDYANWSMDDVDGWKSASFSDSIPHSVSPPDTKSRYWIRVSIVGSTQEITLDALTVRPYTSLIDVKDVQDQLQLNELFDDTSLPSRNTIEDYIRGAEDGLFHITGHYYRPEFIDEELMNFKGFGMKLRYNPILDILDLEVFTGSDWESKREGRNQAWHYEERTGMIYISTIFLDTVAPILRRGYSERRNQGAYKRGVRIRYVHGHDPRRDKFSVEVGRIITKQAALDVIVDDDFARLIPQGLDRVTLNDKIKLWREEIIDFKERYSKLSMF